MIGLKLLNKLNQKKYRQEASLFLVEGRKGVLEAVESTAEVQHLVTTREFSQKNPDFWQLKPIKKYTQGNLVLTIESGDFRHLSDTETPQEIMAVVTLPKTSLATLKTAQTIALLEDIRDPGNLGTIIRTADWFGLGGLLLAGGADPYQPKVVRSSMGSLFHLPIVQSSDLTNEIGQLKKAGFTIVVTRPELETPSLAIPKLGSDTKLCVVFGNEAHGTSALIDRIADTSLSIPKYGAAESLNVAVSFGIIIAQCLQKPGK
jgi:TrmH family RNA methyltransferase